MNVYTIIARIFDRDDLRKAETVEVDQLAWNLSAAFSQAEKQLAKSHPNHHIELSF
jgi:hypothetical protein